MKDGPDIARIAALIGDPARANMLAALMSGKALTATELAHEADITPQTASSHLRKLLDGDLVRLRGQGRHRYYALSGADVAQLLENLMGLAAGRGHLRTRPGPRDTALREARVCYNHLAGRRGVALYRSLLAGGMIREAGDDVSLTNCGRVFVEGFGIDPNALAKRRAPLCRPCLDWSVREYHLAGSLGRALLTRFEVLGWASRASDCRAVRFTRQGGAAFDSVFTPDGPSAC